MYRNIINFQPMRSAINKGEYPDPLNPDTTPVPLIGLHTLLDRIEASYLSYNPDNGSRNSTELDEAVHEHIVDIMTGHVTDNVIDIDPGETFDEVFDTDIVMSREQLREIIRQRLADPASAGDPAEDLERAIVHACLVDQFVTQFHSWFNKQILAQATVVQITVKMSEDPNGELGVDAYKTFFLDMTDRPDFGSLPDTVTDPDGLFYLSPDEPARMAEKLADRLRKNVFCLGGKLLSDLNGNEHNLSVTQKNRANVTITTCRPCVITDHIFRQPLATYVVTDLA